jgi:hypothetical protein
VEWRMMMMMVMMVMKNDDVFALQAQGVDFFFTSRSEMEAAMKQGHFLEISEVSRRTLYQY